MAEKRMFAKTIIDSDAFLDMPQSSQLLYFHLSMRADDDGFINNPKSITRNVKCNEDDLKILAAKKFIIPFESGVVVIKHWKIHNYIAKDRYKETKYKQEKSMLSLDENNSYTEEKILYTECIQPVDKLNTECIQPVYKLNTQIRIDKNSKEKNNSASKDELNDIIDEIWSVYPNKKGKTDAIKKIPKILKTISKDELIKSIERYKKDVEYQRNNGFKTLNYANGSTFFNGRYMDYLEDSEEKTPTYKQIDEDFDY